MTYPQAAEAWDDESWDDESWDDEAFEESVDDEPEFIGGLVRGAASRVGNAIDGLLGARPNRAPLPQLGGGPSAQGVSTATLQTPAGSATLRLPEAVVTRREFESALRKVAQGINRDAARVNAVSKDLENLTTRVGIVVTEGQRDLGKIRDVVTKQGRSTRAALARLRREQSQQQMMSMMMALLAQKQAQDTFDEHVHVAGGPTPVDAGKNDNQMLMLLPMMMGQGGEGGGDNSMMMLPIMMMAINSGKD